MHAPTGGNQSLIAQNGPIMDHTAFGDPFTSMVRITVAAEAGETAIVRSAAVPSAAERITAGMIGLIVYFLMRNPCWLDAGAAGSALIGGRRRQAECRIRRVQGLGYHSSARHGPPPPNGGEDTPL